MEAGTDFVPEGDVGIGSINMAIIAGRGVMVQKEDASTVMQGIEGHYVQAHTHAVEQPRRRWLWCRRVSFSRSSELSWRNEVRRWCSLDPWTSPHQFSVPTFGRVVPEINDRGNPPATAVAGRQR